MTEPMKAIRFDRYGPPDVLRYVDAPRPIPSAGQVLVRIRAASLNPIDWKLRSGAMKAFIPLVLPTGAGQDLAGEIAMVGEGVSDLKIGDAVFAMTDMMPAGAYAEFVALNADWVARKPAALDFAQAAAVPMGALTAWQAIVELGGLSGGDRLFVHGAGGNVGGWAVRIGHALGAEVTAAATARSRDAVLACGADTFVDYDAEPFETGRAEMDVVLDTLSGEFEARSLGMLRKGGILVSTLAPPSAEALASRGLRGAMVAAKPNGAQLGHIGEMIDIGAPPPVIGRLMTLEDAAEAHRLGEAGQVKGKIVLDVP